MYNGVLLGHRKWETRPLAMPGTDLEITVPIQGKEDKSHEASFTRGTENQQQHTNSDAVRRWPEGTGQGVDRGRGVKYAVKGEARPGGEHTMQHTVLPHDLHGVTDQRHPINLITGTSKSSHEKQE